MIAYIKLHSRDTEEMHAHCRRVSRDVTEGFLETGLPEEVRSCHKGEMEAFPSTGTGVVEVQVYKEFQQVRSCSEIGPMINERESYQLGNLAFG